MTSDDIAGYTKTSILDWKLDENKLQEKKNQIDLHKLASTVGTTLKQEQSRQRMLRPPEIDIDRHAANRRSAKRDEQLKPPTSSSKVSSMNRDAIAKGLGQKSVAALKTALRNKSKGL